jgi:hypothetical protein
VADEEVEEGEKVGNLSEPYFSFLYFTSSFLPSFLHSESVWWRLVAKTFLKQH